MKKALLLGSMASLAALSFGCALTDYAGQTGTNTGINIPMNKSHGVISCKTDDRIANTQQTLEAITRDMLYRNSCSPDPFDPSATPGDYVSGEDARDWNRFIGTFAAVQGAGVRGFAPGFDGQWEMAGVKDMADGKRRITTFMTPLPATGFPPFTCGFGAQSNGKFHGGGTEGNVYSNAFSDPGQLAPSNPGLNPETIAMDNTQGFGNALGNCANIVATNPRVQARGGYSTYVGQTRRVSEGRLNFTPITRHDGLAAFVGGGELVAHVSDVTVTAKGELLADGRIAARLISLDRNGVVYTAGDNPIVITVDPANGFGLPQVVGNPAEGVKLAQWAIDARLTDVTTDLAGIQVRELGITLPSISLTVSGSALSKYIADQANGGADNGGGFGG